MLPWDLGADEVGGNSRVDLTADGGCLVSSLIDAKPLRVELDADVEVQRSMCMRLGCRPSDREGLMPSLASLMLAMLIDAVLTESEE